MAEPVAEPQLRVIEVYASLQGESSYAGIPCAFVRLAGCNLRCVWCDSAFTFHGGESRSVAEVAAEALALETPLVELTGGEPLLQPGAHALMTRLLDAGRTVLLETGGSLDIRSVDPRVVRIMDVKCPGSGEVHRNLASNLECLGRRDEAKFVLADRADYVWARDLVRENKLHERCGVLFGAVFGAIEPRELAAWILEDRLPVRMQIQLHKVLWDPDARGV